MSVAFSADSEVCIRLDGRRFDVFFLNFPEALHAAQVWIGAGREVEIFNRKTGDVMAKFPQKDARKKWAEPLLCWPETDLTA